EWIILGLEGVSRGEQQLEADASRRTQEGNVDGITGEFRQVHDRTAKNLTSVYIVVSNDPPRKAAGGAENPFALHPLSATVEWGPLEVRGRREIRHGTVRTVFQPDRRLRPRAGISGRPPGATRR